ncbi:MAG: biopolymer transporter ExbD [Planctomycetota bacterium]
MRGAKKDHDSPEVKLQITPMIDVTFLLLIFFMLLPFRSLERKVAAYLPLEKGITSTDTRVPDPPKISVVLHRKKDEPQTRVKLLDTMVGRGEFGFRTLDSRVAEIHGRNAELSGEIDATGWVPHGDVIRALDAFQKAGVTNVEFRGTKPPGR